jgi:hypothetical protein
MAGLMRIGDLEVLSGKAWPGVSYFCSTRQRVDEGDPFAAFNLGAHVNDNPQRVQANRARLERQTPGPVRWLEQVHGTCVFDVDSQDHLDDVVPRADAAVTCQPGRVLGILTADCLPVVIADTEARALGVAHAGWRGLAGGVLENTVAALQARLPESAVLRAWVGPGIGARVFEVGDEVRQVFTKDDAAATRFFARYGATDAAPVKWLANLPGLAALRLKAAGVVDTELCGHCTYEEPELFYSYRREPVTGRMATLAWLHGQGG